uniref:Uncharacterized protein n=1 Tax=Castor canadensis TaxID=51338 RepID=A0A8C0XEC9_CASCN
RPPLRPDAHPPVAARPVGTPAAPTGEAATPTRRQRRWLVLGPGLGSRCSARLRSARSCPSCGRLIVRAAVSRERNTFFKKRKKEKENDTPPPPSPSPPPHPTPGPIHPPFPLPVASHRLGAGHLVDQCPNGNPQKP